MTKKIVTVFFLLFAIMFSSAEIVKADVQESYVKMQELERNGKYQEAYDEAKTVYDFLNDKMGPTDNQTLGIYLTMGRYDFLLSRKEEAKEKYYYVYDKFVEKFTATGKEMFGIYQQMVSLHIALKEYDKAAEYYDKMQEVIKVNAGDLEDYTPMVMIGKAELYGRKKDEKTMIEKYLEVLEHFKKEKGEKSTEYIGFLGDVGNKYASIREYNTAYEFLEKGVAEASKNDSLKYDEAMNRKYLGELDLKFYKTKSALKQFKKAEMQMKKDRGRDYYQTGYIMLNVASTLERMYKYKAASKMYQKVLKYQSGDTTGAKDQLIMYTYRLAAINAYRLNDYKTAKQHIDSAYAIMTKPEKISDPRKVSIASMFISLYTVIDEIDRAYELTKDLNLEHEDIEESVKMRYKSSMAYLKTKEDKYDDAVKLYKEVLDYNIKEDKGEHYGLWGDFENLGEAYLGAGDVDKALENLNKAYTLFQSEVKTEESALSSLFGFLGAAYGEKGDNANADKFFDKALALRKKSLGNSHKTNKKLFTLAKKYYEKSGNSAKAGEMDSLLAAIK